jgi:hypothetical protein
MNTTAGKTDLGALRNGVDVEHGKYEMHGFRTQERDDLHASENGDSSAFALAFAQLWRCDFG